MRRNFVLALLGVLVFGTVVRASPEPLAIRVSGEVGVTSSTITVSVPEGSTRAIAVFSEPSHTLLTLVYDGSGTDNPVESDWYRREVGAASSARLMSLPLQDGASGRIQTVAKVEGDDEIGFKILGRGSDRAATYSGRVRTAWPFDFTVAP
jgi:hypothetical protein